MLRSMEVRICDGSFVAASLEDMGLVGEHYVSKFILGGRVVCSLIGRDAVAEHGVAARVRMDDAVLGLHGVCEIVTY